MAGGGSKPTEIKSKFDPRVTTLREVVDLYAKDARAEGRKIENFEKTFDLPGLKDMLDRPAIDMFEGSWDGDLNPLEAALQGKRESTHRAVISAVSNIQRNVEREAGRLRLNSGLIKITDTVYIPAKSQAYTKSFGYNPYKIGFLTEALVKYVESNPADKPIANAIMFQLQTGLRPSAVGGLPTASFKTSERPGGSPGIFIPKGMKGVKTNNNINIPLSRRSIAILQDQSEYNKAEFGGSEGFFVRRVKKNELASVDDGDVNRVLRKLKSSFGIKQDLRTIDTPDVPYLTSYDLRRLNATAFDQLGVDVNNAGALIGRPIQSGTEQARYIGATAGVYGDAATEDINKLSNFFHQQYAETLDGAKEAGQQGKSLSLNTMLFDGETPEFTDIETEAPAPIKIQKFDVGTDIQVEEKGSVKATDSQVDTTSKQPSPELQEQLSKNNLNFADIVANFGKKVLPVGLVGAGILADTESFARDVAIEGAALASKVPAGPAGALPMIVASKEVGAGELQPDDRPATQEELVQATVDRGSMTREEAIQFRADNDPQIQQEIMEQEAMRDASFLNIDRGPEANSVNQSQGFLSR